MCIVGDSGHTRLRDEDDELLQFAIQQSLMEAGTENDKVVPHSSSHTVLLSDLILALLIW